MHLGIIFKKFRESRQLKLKDIATKELSTSQISRFEHGKSDLTIGKLLKALEEMNMTIDEFMYAFRDCKQNQLDELIVKINILINKKDIDGMKLLLDVENKNIKTKKRFKEINIILIKAKLEGLTEETYISKNDIAYLTDYLFSITFWGYYELLIFSNTLDVINHNTFMILSREISNRSEIYKEIPQNRQLISNMLLHSFVTCIERNEWLDALYFKEQLKNLAFKETEVYERLFFHFAKNLYDYKKNKNIDAITEIKECINSMKLVSNYNLASYFESYLESIHVK